MPNWITPEQDCPGDLEYTEEYEDTHTGDKVLVRRYKNGRSTVYWGGPCGSTDYDEYGEEC